MNYNSYPFFPNTANICSLEVIRIGSSSFLLIYRGASDNIMISVAYGILRMYSKLHPVSFAIW